MARLREIYKKEIVPALTKQFGYQSVMQVPRVSKVVLNMGVGEAVGDKKLLENGLLLLTCGTRSIRFRPALNLSPADADAALDIVRKTLKQI